ncbi:hypothetical protein J6590_082095 [Homalodisca vitripennis]|nr:hypothetical protein J6590_082095 [Homalodisca vitripennis]
MRYTTVKPSQLGVRIVNNLPNSIKCVPMLKAFKARPKTTLISHAFYSIDEFMAHNWETSQLAD